MGVGHGGGPGLDFIVMLLLTCACCGQSSVTSASCDELRQAGTWHDVLVLRHIGWVDHENQQDFVSTAEYVVLWVSYLHTACYMH